MILNSKTIVDSELSSPALTPAREEAVQYVTQLRSFYTTLLSYVVVNMGVWVFNLMQGGKLWAYWITLGWGIGLAIWASRLFLRSDDWFFGRQWQERQIEARLAKENLKTVSTQKQALQAQLRLLQAQIEPHFLFNTLANIQSLIQSSPAQATHMLDGLILYLRQSLTTSRTTRCTLEVELQLVQRYLELIKIRMGERLQFQIDVPAAVLPVTFAPLLLQPLVENAIRHALEPKVEGGFLNIVARELADGYIEVQVRDNGLGFKPSGGEGVGLSNVRERLALIFEGDAIFTIVDANPGTTATIRFKSQP